MAKKMVECRHCGEDIAKSAKTCPHCGAKNKKPFYKKWWFWLIVVLLVIGSGGNSDSNEDKSSSSSSKSNQETSSQESEPQEPEISYTSYSVSQMMEDLEKNALSAEETYDGEYVKIIGRLNVIDSDGKYISIVSSDDEWAIMGVQCYLQTEEHKEQVMNMSVGDNITLTGEITDVGEVLGYVLDIHEFLE